MLDYIHILSVRPISRPELGYKMLCKLFLSCGRGPARGGARSDCRLKAGSLERKGAD